LLSAATGAGPIACTGTIATTARTNLFSSSARAGSRFGPIEGEISAAGTGAATFRSTAGPIMQELGCSPARKCTACDGTGKRAATRPPTTTEAGQI
jgi:hypothetical protein